MSAVAEQIVQQFDEIVRPDGGRVEFIEIADGKMSVRYYPGTNEECESCVMSGDALGGMMQDMAKSLDPSIESVFVEEVSG